VIVIPSLNRYTDAFIAQPVALIDTPLRPVASRSVTYDWQIVPRRIDALACGGGFYTEVVQVSSPPGGATYTHPSPGERPTIG
jgi:hypothetical protein